MTHAFRRWYPARAAAGRVRPVTSLLLALLLGVTATPVIAEEAAAPARPELLFGRIPPDIIVNLRGSGSHYLMVTAEIQTRSQADIDNTLKHAAAVRHDLLMMMGEVGYREALTPEGRQKMADDALAIVRKVLDAETGGNAVEAVLFTSYLVE